MPMTDHDELLARAEAELAAESGPSGMHYGDSTKRELYVALWAALAARPQPLFEGTMLEMEDWVHGWETADALQRVVVYPAVAGSATLTGDDDGSMC